ncbi:MAG: L,D-transpeptidase [Pseudomonadota bacterium]
MAATSNPMLHAQVLLDRAHFSAGEIDGAYGQNMRRAIAGYQQAKGLTVSGKMDAATWAALDEQTPALTTYTITEADAAGPHNAVPEAMADKAKLPSLDYSSAVEALGERFHASPGLLKRLNPGKDFSRAGEEISVPNTEGAPALPRAATIVIDRSDRVLTLRDGAGQVIAQFPASTGSEHDPLPIGTWKVKGVAHKPVFHYNPKLFWDAAPGETSAKIPAGPNNPVGVVWIDLSKEHYGIHGTPEPAGIGKTQSHGCIRLTNWDAATVAQAVAPGLPVIMQE